MNLKTVVPLGAAVVLGLVAAIVARQLVQQAPAVVVDGAPSNISLTDIVVASRDIPPGATLTADDLTVARVESKNAPHNVPGTPSALFNRVAKIQIPQGQIVHESLLAESGVSGGLPGVIQPGFRAMTIEVNEFTGLAGLLQPGNHIDVIARIADGDKGQMTKTIAQNIQIIAVGTDLTNKTATTDTSSALKPEEQSQQQIKQFARAITVLVTPEDAERIDLAAANNQARLVLRASTDNEKATVAGATLAALRGDSPMTPVPPVKIDDEVEVKTAGLLPGDDVFGTQQSPAFKPRGKTRSITVIRAGIPTVVEVEDTKSTEKDTTAGGSDFFTPLGE